VTLEEQNPGLSAGPLPRDAVAPKLLTTVGGRDLEPLTQVHRE